jgi:hypothetical protein
VEADWLTCARQVEALPPHAAFGAHAPASGVGGAHVDPEELGPLLDAAELVLDVEVALVVATEVEAPAPDELALVVAPPVPVVVLALLPSPTTVEPHATPVSTSARDTARKEARCFMMQG